MKAKKNLDAMRTFVDMFDVPLAVGREARLHLAETIVERDDRPAFLEAELNLQQLRGSDYFSDASVSARALAALAKLEEKKTIARIAMKLAAMYYRELRRDYPKVPLADGKTGAEAARRADHRPALPAPAGRAGPALDQRKDSLARCCSDVKPGQQGFVFQPEGDLTPLMKQTRLLLDTNSMPPRLHCYNFASNSLRWTVELGTPQFNTAGLPGALRQSQPDRASTIPTPASASIRCAATWPWFRWAPWPTASTWTRADPLAAQPVRGPQPELDVLHQIPDRSPRGNLDFVFTPTSTTEQITYMPVGHVGAVQASYVALMTPKGLVVVDPLRRHAAVAQAGRADHQTARVWRRSVPCSRWT